MDSDFEPYGKRHRDDADCSGGRRHFAILDGVLGADWGVCMDKERVFDPDFFDLFRQSAQPFVTARFNVKSAPFLR